MNDSGTLKFVDDVEFHPNQLRQIESDNVEDRRNEPPFNDPRPPRIVDADESEMTHNYFFKSIMPATQMGLEAGHGDIEGAAAEIHRQSQEQTRKDIADVQKIMDDMKKKSMKKK